MNVVTITFRSGARSLQTIKQIREWASPRHTLWTAKQIFDEAAKDNTPITIQVDRVEASDAIKAFQEIGCKILHTSLDAEANSDEDFAILKRAILALPPVEQPKALESFSRVKASYDALRTSHATRN